MKKLYLSILLCCLAIAQVAWADGVQHIAFHETFMNNPNKGGRDNDFGEGSSIPYYNLDGWTGTNATKIYGAHECIRFGTGNTDGVCTTPEIILVGTGKTATLTFSAAGWSGTAKNTLRITANEGVSLTGDTNITLTNSSWEEYSVTITLTTATYIQLTFSGRRGYLDDVKVTEDVTAINAPTLPNDHLFWANTTEEATTNITLVPSDSTTVYYTTDGTEPSKSNGNIATLTSNFKITGTTTIKARAYYETIASNLVTKTYTVGETVNSIEDFKARAEGDEVLLFIPYDSQTRLLHGQDGKAYLYDNTGPLCLDFGTTATFTPAPQHNQHVAGWIVGKKQTADGLLKLVATNNTNTSHLALAAPVTEAATSPVTIDENTELNAHIGNWVKAEDLRDGAFNINGSYDGALVDVSGIVTASNTITPMEIDNIAPLIFIIDEGKDFTSPNANIENAAIRLKRTLTANQWNTFCVPFDITNLNGSIREYDEIDGTTMKFKDANSIQAGKPYLVKPNADIANPVYNDVTLSATSAQSITSGDYSFVATYSPRELATDKTQLFLTSSGKLAYPSSTSAAIIKGMRAYFDVPAGANARILVDDETITDINQIESSKQKVQSYYDLQGRKVEKAQKGVYIAKGKKLIIK